VPADLCVPGHEGQVDRGFEIVELQLDVVESRRDVRNSADPSGSVLVLSRARWARLISRVKELGGPDS
jgi:hypothetical protein